MILQIDTTEKVIKVEGTVSFGESDSIGNTTLNSDSLVSGDTTIINPNTPFTLT